MLSCSLDWASTRLRLELSVDFNPSLLVLSLVLLDAQNIVAPLRRDNVLRAGEEVNNDFTIVVPLFGDSSYFRNGSFLMQYRENTLLAVNVSNEHMAKFADAKEQEGWRVSRVLTSGEPSVVSTLGVALSDVTTTYTIRMDGDSYMKRHPGEAVGAADKAKADLCSVKVLASNQGNLIEKLQATEYAISMQGRHNQPWATSGACMVARTTSLRHILKNHSHWYYGEDMETGRVAKHFGMKVRHIDFEVFTEVPETFRAWFRQRQGWWAGNFRLAWVNFEQNFRYPVWMFYNAVLIWVLLTAKWTHILEALTYLPWLIMLYTFITVVANWRVRSPWMILTPYYSLVQAMVMPPLGAIRYFKIALRTGKWGRFLVGPLRGKVRAGYGT